VSGLLLQTLRHETPSAPDGRWCQPSIRLRRSSPATSSSVVRNRFQISLLGRINKTDPAGGANAFLAEQCRCFYKNVLISGWAQLNTDARLIDVSSLLKTPDRASPSFVQAATARPWRTSRRKSTRRQPCALLISGITTRKDPKRCRPLGAPR
jgi:hypothetical protein